MHVQGKVQAKGTWDKPAGSIGGGYCDTAATSTYWSRTTTAKGKTMLLP
jgi:hypothetical protein